MRSPDAELRDQVARQFDELMSGPLATSSERATALLARHVPRGDPTPGRRRLWDDIQARYLAQQTGVAQDGRAALRNRGQVHGSCRWTPTCR